MATAHSWRICCHNETCYGTQQKLTNSKLLSSDSPRTRRLIPTTSTQDQPVPPSIITFCFKLKVILIPRLLARVWLLALKNREREACVARVIRGPPWEKRRVIPLGSFRRIRLQHKVIDHLVFRLPVTFFGSFLVSKKELVQANETSSENLIFRNNQLLTIWIFSIYQSLPCQPPFI